MPSRLAALLTMLACLVVVAPAAASERSEARRYAAAMEPKIVLTPEEGEALVAGVEARAAHVASTCLASVEAAAKKQERANLLMLLYDAHLAVDVYARYATWLKEGDERLAAIPTRSRILRRARAVRPQAARMLSGLSELAPKDFCAMVTAWEATGFKGRVEEADALLDLLRDIGPQRRAERAMRRATKLLKRHGATRAQRAAFQGDGQFPELREPAKDPVADLLMPGRDGADGAGTRQPLAAASGTDAG